MLCRRSGDVIEEGWGENFNAVSHETARSHSQVLFLSTMSVKCSASTVHRWTLGSFQPYTACRSLNGTRNIRSIYMNGWKVSWGSGLVLDSKESNVWKVQFRIMDQLVSMKIISHLVLYCYVLLTVFIVCLGGNKDIVFIVVSCVSLFRQIFF